MLKLLVLAVIAFLLLGGAARLVVAGGARSLNAADRLLGGTRSAELVAQGIAFGTDARQRLDIWAPSDRTGSDALPVVVFFYGGGWHSGERGDYGFAGRALAEAGFIVVIPDYRLTPAARWPAFVEDSAAAIAWTHRHIAAHGGDADRIALAGHSAGAYNAVMTALDRQWLAAHGLDPSVLRGVAALAGPFDFLPLERGGSADKAMGKVRPPERTQPIRFARGDAPPLWLATGSDDGTVKPRNSMKLAAAITAAGGAAEMVTYPGMGHSGIIMALAHPLANRSAVRDDMTAWLRAATARRVLPVTGVALDEPRQSP